ncbi:putative reverse transcriptase domain-containing protein [Tanacetum coccineum]|uniref:Reverse transcriptase domain-containing protein n=1 Tax=Tanacetum coccineum TaxID=301880 RepID=A0ABQ5A8W8_9ASTR
MYAMMSRLQTHIPSRPCLEVMATPVIPILSDLSEESVGSHVPRVILFGAIPTIILVIPRVPAEVPIIHADPLVTSEVGAVCVTLPTKVLNLVDYSSSDSDPSKDSLPPAPELPLVLPFLCSDNSEADSKFEPAKQRPERHESLAIHDDMVLRWRDMVTSRPSSPSGSSSHDTLASSSEFPVAPVAAPPRIRRQPTILIRPRDAILFSRPYCTHSNGPHKLLTARNIVGPFPCMETWCDTSGQTHSGPSTRVASYRLVYPLVMTLRYNEAFSRWRSSTTSVSLSTPVSRSIAPTHANLLPLRKRFRDLYSPEDSREEHMEIGTTDAKVVAYLGIGDGVNTEDGIGMGVEISASDIREDEEEFKAEANVGRTMEIAVDPLVIGGISESTGGYIHDLEGTLYDIVHYMSEVPLDRITEFETTQRQFEAGQLMANEKRAGLADRIRRLGRENLREEFCQIRRDHNDAQRRLRRLESLIAQRVAEALANYEATRAANALEAESQSQNGNDGDNGNGNGNHGGGGNDRNGNPNENGRGAMPVARVCTYQDFVKCQPLNFKGIEGLVGLTIWFKKMETVFHINNCPEVYQVKYATCTLLDNALTWWNSHKRTIGVDAAFAMTWRDLMKLMTEVYCPRNEIQKMETKLWNLTVKNNDLADYTQRFQELTLLCTRMVLGEKDRIERYVGGLPDNIQGNVMFAEPTRLQDVIRLANSLMDQKLKGYAIRSAENKRKFESNQRDNHAQLMYKGLKTM